MSAPGLSAGDAGSTNQVFERRLAAIAVIDVEGYSSLMEQDEQGTHARWTEMRTTVIVPKVRAHRGEIIKSTGDGFLLEFRSAVDAVHWALDLEATLASRSDDRMLTIRIAVHLADIIPEAHDIFGDGVNIVSRLQAYADPGGIVVSSAVHDQVRLAVEYEATPLGPLMLKNIDRPVEAFRIRSGTTRAARRTVQKIGRRDPSIAVLPMRTFGSGAVDPWLAEGVVHDIVASLTGLKELFVISSTSTAAVVRMSTDVVEVGRRLDVRYVVTGSVARARDRLRIHAELTDVDTRSNIWSGRYDIEDTELFATQDVIASKIAYALVPHLRQSEFDRALRKPPEEMGAYDYVLQALYKLYRIGDDEFREAREFLDKAIARDPRYSMAYALLAKWYMFRIGQGASPDVGADSREALRVAQMALEHNPFDPLALSIYGHTLSFLFADFDRALDAFDRALASSPNSALAWGFSSPTFSYLGESATAVQRAEYALRLSPLDPYAYWLQTALTLAHYFHGTYDECVHWGRKTLAANPRFTANLRPLIGGLAALGRLEEAREIGGALLALEPGFRVDRFIERYPVRDPAAKAAFAARLREAGLPQ
jgi:adenylate cyclase